MLRLENSVEYIALACKCRLQLRYRNAKFGTPEYAVEIERSGDIFQPGTPDDDWIGIQNQSMG